MRVELDVTRPLKRRMKLKKEWDNEEWFWVDFKYKRLRMFCFICDLIDHLERFCPKLYLGGQNQQIERLYGSWMRAPTRRNQLQGGARWLRPEIEGTMKQGNRAGERNLGFGRGEIPGEYMRQTHGILWDLSQ